MCIIDHQGKLIGHLHHLNTAFYFGYLQGFQNILFGNLEMTADCNGCQGIVDAEFTWNVNFHREIHKSLQMVGNSKISLAANQLGVLCAKVCFL